MPNILLWICDGAAEIGQALYIDSEGRRIYVAYKAETLAKLTSALSGEIDLYNEIITTEQEHEAKIVAAQTELAETAKKLADAETRGQNYLGQISNLLSKIPVGESKATKTAEEKIEEIKNQKWTK